MICSRANVDLKSETKDETGNLKQSVTQTSLKASPSLAVGNHHPNRNEIAATQTGELK